MPMVFSYGTLQQDSVQLATFGGRLRGHQDELVGFELSAVEIEDPELAASLGQTHHANVVRSARSTSRVAGTALEITDAELSAADEYEKRAQYTRIAVMLASGQSAWVYVDGRSLASGLANRCGRT